MPKKSKCPDVLLGTKGAGLWSQAIRQGKDVFRDLYNNPEFLKFIGDIHGKNILDVGCGEGYNTRIFAQHGAHITGIDVSEQMIRCAQDEEQKHPLGIEYKVASWGNLSAFKNEAFDVVLSTMALMDGPGYEDALKEFYRVLKPNGSLFFSVTHPCFLTPNYTKLTNEQGNITHRVVSHYFKEEPWEFSWELTKNADKSDAHPVTALHYHRTLSTYINNVLKTGFVLKEIHEPCPSDEACEKNPRLKVARDVAPSFLYVHAVKP
ncbi:MAG: class I SAM-dependent methyltransferase [Candidatus Babeliales bacterium]|jgi:ubiquinone/menaquinone biosynthesis C-methylase UbiE